MEASEINLGSEGRKKPVYRFSSRVVAPIAFATDVLCLLAAAPAAVMLHALFVGGQHNLKVHISAGAIVLIAFLLIRISRDAYSSPLSRTNEGDTGVVLDFFIAVMLAVSVVWQFGLASEFSRGLVLFYAASAVVTLFFSRFALRFIIRKLSQGGRISQRVVLFGCAEETTARALRLLELERLPHLQIVGVADDRPTGAVPTAVGSVPFIGGFREVADLAREGKVDQVLIGIPDITQQRLDEIIENLSGVSVDLCLMPRETLLLSASYRVGFIGASPVLSIWERPVRDTDIIIKDIEDKLLALIGLLLLSPLLLFVAAAIKLTSPGPVLFVQRRFGFNNTAISVLKFRSMYIDRQDVSGAERTTKNDRRVTPVGRLIRALSIDELPQLWNVLRGDMSIVGPRPHATEMKVGDHYYFEAVKGYAARHRVRPGLTGLAQVRGLRGEIATIERARMRVEYDRFYIENWSLALDIRIILETIFKVVFDRNAY